MTSLGVHFFFLFFFIVFSNFTVERELSCLILYFVPKVLILGGQTLQSDSLTFLEVKTDVSVATLVKVCRQDLGVVGD